MCGNYSREETIQGRKLYEEILYKSRFVYKHTQAGVFWSLDERFENTGKTHRPSFEKIVACFKSFSYHLEKSQALIRLDTTALHL